MGLPLELLLRWCYALRMTPESSPFAIPHAAPETNSRHPLPFTTEDGNAIVLENLDKIYRSRSGDSGKHALKGVSLQIPAGCIYGLLGPNGAGKSTLINILAGTVIKTSGRVRIWDTELDEDPRQARANIGVVPQEVNTDAFFTPRETLEMMAGLFGVAPRQRITDQLLAMVGLADKAHAYSRTLSGGMKRRLMVAKAMVHRPPVLILDEPTAGVDVELRQRLWAMVRQLNQAGVTIILTTHYLEEAEQLCDRIAIINHGRLIADADKASLLKAAGKKQLLITLAEAPAKLPDSLLGVGAVLEGRLLQLDLGTAGADTARLLAILTDAGFVISEITTREPDLEEVFLQLTRADSSSLASPTGD